MKLKKIIIMSIAAAMLAANSSFAVFAEDEAATRGYVADYLLKAADFYNPGVQKTDIIKGYDDGQLHEENGVTRAEALVMLERAFGKLPELKGHNKRTAFPSETFTDVPEWAKSELEDVFNAGIVRGKSDGIFAPDDPVTKEQLATFCRRVFAIFGTNEKDDFYAAINKDDLEKSEIKQGRSSSGVMNELNDKATENVIKIVKELADKQNEKGTPEQKVADLYKNITDKEAIDKVGLTPIKKYLDEIDTIKTIDDMKAFETKVRAELFMNLFAGTSLSVDAKDSTKYSLQFSTLSPLMGKDFYAGAAPAQYNSYIKFLKSVLMLSGEDENAAAGDAEKIYNLEKTLSASTLNPQDYYNVDKVYNAYKFDDLAKQLGNIDLNKVLTEDGLKKEDIIIVSDVGLTEEFVKLYTDDNIESLKAAAKFNIISGFGSALSSEYTTIADTFNQEYIGISGSYSDDEKAIASLESIMPEYMGKLYSDKFFSEEAKKDVTNMIKDMISVYDKRIDNLSWMSSATKEKAKEKLASIKIKVGYPDKWDTYMDNVDIKSKSEGGSYFDNVLAIAKEACAYGVSQQGKPVDKDVWAMPAFMVNACYDPSANDITFPAAILQAPMYDVNASYEQNLGGIGFVIAHEITHAFDNSGAKFDKDGNAADWWTKEDYDQFKKLCSDMIDFYDNWEAAPGIAESGEQTLSENIADQGSIACITEIAAGLENPDYKAMYSQLAKCWMITSSREYMQYLTQIDVHSLGKLRVNRTVVNCDAFYSAFDVNENDAMYVSPENRVKIW